MQKAAIPEEILSYQCNVAKFETKINQLSELIQSSVERARKHKQDLPQERLEEMKLKKSVLASEYQALLQAKKMLSQQFFLN